MQCHCIFPLGLWEGPEKNLEIKKLDISFMDVFIVIERDSKNIYFDLRIFIITREIKSEKYYGGKLP